MAEQKNDNKKELELKGMNSTYNIQKMQDGVKVAKVLKGLILKEKLYTVIQNHNYVNVEGWMIAGSLIGYDAVVEEVTNYSTEKEIKWGAKVVIRDRKGAVVSVGYALCSSYESKKKTFDEYAILSMAQTRAIGKAFRNKIGWLMKLAGYEATVAEEMTQQASNETERDGKMDTIFATIKSVRTPDALDHLKADLRQQAKDKKFTKEENAKIKKALDDKESELSVPTA